MKSLVEFLNPNNRVYMSFPEKPIENDILEYFKIRGFIEIEDDSFAYTTMSEKLQRTNSPAYIYYINDNATVNYVCFHNGGKISKTNPVFFLRLYEKQDGHAAENSYFIWYEDLEVGKLNSQMHSYKSTEYDTVVKLINKYLNK